MNERKEKIWRCPCSSFVLQFAAVTVPPICSSATKPTNRGVGVAFLVFDCVCFFVGSLPLFDGGIAQQGSGMDHWSEGAMWVIVLAEN